MIRFNCDYQEGAHPRILEALMQPNMVQTCGYGEDEICEAARARIRSLCNAPQAGVPFLVGGTQANFTLLAAALRSYQGVLAAETAHIATHETGAVAVSYTHLKILEIYQQNLKEIGININIAAMDNSAYNEARNNGQSKVAWGNVVAG